MKTPREVIVREDGLAKSVFIRIRPGEVHHVSAVEPGATIIHYDEAGLVIGFEVRDAIFIGNAVTGQQSRQQGGVRFNPRPRGGANI
jgi:uncharacterized protein YuzE